MESEITETRVTRLLITRVTEAHALLSRGTFSHEGSCASSEGLLSLRFRIQDCASIMSIIVVSTTSLYKEACSPISHARRLSEEVTSPQALANSVLVKRRVCRARDGIWESQILPAEAHRLAPQKYLYSLIKPSATPENPRNPNKTEPEACSPESYPYHPLSNP